MIAAGAVYLLVMGWSLNDESNDRDAEIRNRFRELKKSGKLKPSGKEKRTRRRHTSYGEITFVPRDSPLPPLQANRTRSILLGGIGTVLLAVGGTLFVLSTPTTEPTP